MDLPAVALPAANDVAGDRKAKHPAMKNTGYFMLILHFTTPRERKS
jgi:hypothetical protein